MFLLDFNRVLFLEQKITLFISGTQANASNFQAYLVEGLTRWNEDRASAHQKKTQSDTAHLHCYNSQLVNSVNKMSKAIFNKEPLPDVRAPGKYTGN